MRALTIIAALASIGSFVLAAYALYRSRGARIGRLAAGAGSAAGTISGSIAGAGRAG